MNNNFDFNGQVIPLDQIEYISMLRVKVNCLNGFWGLFQKDKNLKFSSQYNFKVCFNDKMKSKVIYSKEFKFIGVKNIKHDKDFKKTYYSLVSRWRKYNSDN